MLAKVGRRLTFPNVTAALALGVALSGGAFALGAIPGANGTINACFARKTGQLRVVDSAKPKCKKGEKAISWNQRGPAGATGAVGAAGAAGAGGAQGAQGPQGAQGQKGETGAQGVPGNNGAPGAPGADGQDGQDGSPDTPAQVLGKITGVDGAGSGLDADLVDGQPPAWSQHGAAGIPENGATVQYTTIATIPNMGTIEADCNTEANHDIRFAYNTAGNVHLMVDTGAGNATLAEDINSGTSTPINVTSMTASQPEFQIWRLTRSTTTATVFVEMYPANATTCQWRTQVIGTT